MARIAKVKALMQFLHINDAESYMVGGCVRDMLINRHVNDYDLACELIPDKLEEVCKGYFKTLATGKKHGTITVIVEDEHIEATTFRGDYNCDGRHADVEFVSNIEEDLARRDFTINAMAINRMGETIDPFGGREDLKAHRIKCVGDPETRFKEDYLRIMRALRFACQLCFDIEPATYAAIKKYRGRLTLISKERIRDELIKMLKGNAPKAFQLLMDTGVMEVILPEVALTRGVDGGNKHGETIDEHLLECLKVSTGREEPETLLAVMLHDVAKPLCAVPDEEKGFKFVGHDYVGAEVAKDILRRLKFPSKTVDHVSSLILNHMALNGEPKAKTIRKLASKYGFEFVHELARLKCYDGWGNKKKDANWVRLRFEETRNLIKNVEDKEGQITIKDLAIGGKDLTELGMEPGPDMGRVLNRLWAVVINNPELNTKEKLCELAMKRW